jgi:hypothetical protein
MSGAAPSMSAPAPAAEEAMPPTRRAARRHAARHTSRRAARRGAEPSDNVANQLNREEAQRNGSGTSMPPSAMSSSADGMSQGPGMAAPAPGAMPPPSGAKRR